MIYISTARLARQEEKILSTLLLAEAVLVLPQLLVLAG